ncbi:MAG: Hsp20/alpha crystallin family protein [Proteobacteria bacterium]|nr:Hsp20/alpha crystallin family protein [Pseudomonadota bacterium]MBS0464407.1 Hsp20/alpha crystallin family protein [Pseudomonadota bacterium]
MNVNRYAQALRPWGAVGFNDEMKQVFDKFFGEVDGESNVVTSQWAPRVDIKEEADRFVIFADIPGVEPKDIEIHMDKGVLTLKGERSSESTHQSDRYSRVERAHGAFYRRFALPDSANAEGIAATGKHGVLEISIPKKPETTPRRIQVS